MKALRNAAGFPIRCEWAIERGHWKGYTCGNNAHHEYNGGHYCHVHLGKAVEREAERCRAAATA